MTALKKEFESAVANSTQLKVKPDDDTLLELYSYFKQATEGDVGGERPGPFDFKARAKYDAWAARKGMNAEIAMRGYIKLVKHLAAKK
jgi:acyl-CoA-binding protein